MAYSSQVLRIKKEVGYVKRIDGDEAWVLFKRDGQDVRTRFPLHMLEAKGLALENYPVQLTRELRRSGRLTYYFGLAPKSYYQPFDPEIDRLKVMTHKELLALSRSRKKKKIPANV